MGTKQQSISEQGVTRVVPKWTYHKHVHFVGGTTLSKPNMPDLGSSWWIQATMNGFTRSNTGRRLHGYFTCQPHGWIDKLVLQLEWDAIPKSTTLSHPSMKRELAIGMTLPVSGDTRDTKSTKCVWTTNPKLRWLWSFHIISTKVTRLVGTGE